MRQSVDEVALDHRTTAHSRRMCKNSVTRSITLTARLPTALTTWGARCLFWADQSAPHSLCARFTACANLELRRIDET